jgi:hypothetical protein
MTPQPAYTGAGGNDWRLQHAATWYRNLFGREPSTGEYQKWADHYRRGGTTEEVLVSLLASDEYWNRTGGDFMDWFMASALMASRPVTPQQAAQWREVYRQQNRDRDAVLHRFFDATGVFNQERAATGSPGPELPSDPSPYRYGRSVPRTGFGGVGYGGGVPWYADDASRHGRYGSSGYSGRYETGYRGYYSHDH